MSIATLARLPDPPGKLLGNCIRCHGAFRQDQPTRVLCRPCKRALTDNHRAAERAQWSQAL